MVVRWFFKVMGKLNKREMEKVTEVRNWSGGSG
jgi:hypothetical protein